MVTWNYPTSWDALTPEQRATGMFGDKDTFQTFRDFQIGHAQPWIQQGLNTSIDAQTLQQLQAALAANPSGRLQIGESNAGAYYGEDPSLTVGDYTIGTDGTIGKVLSRETWGQDVGAIYGPDGQLIGIGSGDSTALGLAKFIAMSAAAYGGANALNGASGAGAAGGATEAAAAAPGSMSAESLLGGLAEGPTLTGSSVLTSGGTPLAGTTLADAGLGAAGVSSGLSGLSNAAKIASSVLNAGSVLGAVAGALDGQDKQQTSSRDPWAAAQPFLKQLLGDGQTLYGQYRDQPFSPGQQTAYSNYGGLLNAINGGAQGLLSGFSANASGANNYDRSNPRKTLQGSNFDLSSFQPGLLNFFPRG